MSKYTVSGVGYESYDDALVAAGKEADKRLGQQRDNVSGRDMADATVKVWREDGTVAATVRPSL